MARFKMLARRSMIATAFVGFFGIASAVAYQAAGAALSLGSLVVPR